MARGDTILINNANTDYHAHQEGIFNPDYARKVIVIGAGSVGSHVVYMLTKMGVGDIEVWDDDTVASHNIPMSIYGPGDVGQYKVDALKSLITQLTGVELTVVRNKYDGENLSGYAVVIMCVDTMSARKQIWERVKLCPTVDLLCDTRTAVTYLEVLSVSPCDTEDIERYEALLFPDDRAARQACGRHGIVYVAARAAQIVAVNVALFWQEGRAEWRIAEQCSTLDLVFGPTK